MPFFNYFFFVVINCIQGFFNDLRPNSLIINYSYNRIYFDFGKFTTIRDMNMNGFMVIRIEKESYSKYCNCKECDPRSRGGKGVG